jgi:hypothetical protein
MLRDCWAVHLKLGVQHMTRTSKIAFPFLLVIVAALWCALSRPEALLLAVPFLVALCFRQVRAQRTLVATVCVILVVWPMQPLAITFQNAPGSPRVVRGCVMVGSLGYAAAIEAQRRGECVVASDISGIVEPKYYVIW